MPKQLVMDHTGHSTHVFDAADKVAVAEAQARFDRLRKEGFIAYAREDRGGGATGRVLQAFDPAVEETLFSPQLKGG